MHGRDPASKCLHAVESNPGQPCSLIHPILAVPGRALRPMSGRRGAVEAEFDYRQLPAARAAPGIGSGLGPAPGGLLLRNPDWLSPGGAGKLPPVAGRGGAKLPPVMYSNERAPAAVGAPTSTSAVALPQQQEAAAGLTISESATVAPPPQPQGDASLQNQEQRPHSTAQVQPQYAASPPMAVGTTAAAQPTANPEQQLQSPSESATADTWHALESNYTSAQPPSSHPSPERHAIKPVHEAVLEVGSDEDDACGDNAWGGAEELASAGRVLAATCAAGSSAAVGALAATPHAVTTPLQGQQLAGAAAIGGAAQHSAVAASGICSGKRGGWGEGALAAPGTLMVGSQAPPADADEDVFGGCDAWGTPGPHAIAAAARAPQTGANGVAAPHNTCVVANLGSAADDAVVEDFEDEDVTAELAAQGALPGDLAAKLAQYERMLEEDVE